MEALGAFGCALRYNPGVSDSPWEEGREPGWEVYDVEGHAAFCMGSGRSWQAAYVDALVVLGSLGYEDDGMVGANLTDEDRRELERVRDQIDAHLRDAAASEPIP